MPEQAYNVYEDRCPTRLVLDRLADKWALLILDRLRGGPLRFNHIRREIKGISQKVLSQTLRKLERNGFDLAHDLSNRAGDRRICADAARVHPDGDRFGAHPLGREEYG